jgi:hypothetical protein
MNFASRQKEVDAVDRFLVAQKTLYGAPPDFGPKRHEATKKQYWEAIWPIQVAGGSVGAGHLRILVGPTAEASMSLVITFQNNAVYRLDFDAADKCESNPLFAKAIGLPPRVCGPHVHVWERNRAHVLSQMQWSLPCREPLSLRVRKFNQALPWLADQVNLLLTPEQRGYEFPVHLI